MVSKNSVQIEGKVERKEGFKGKERKKKKTFK